MKNRAGELLAFLIISITALMILNDAYKIKNGWMHPETAVWSVIYLSDDIYEKIGLSFNPSELKKIFWWEQYVDFGLTRLLTASFQLIDVKFRTWLFQYVPPNPAVSLSWLFTLIFIPLLLFRFLRRYIKLGVVGSTVITVFYLASPATGSLTFFNFHPGKTLPIFFILLIFNICIKLNELTLNGEQNNKKLTKIYILLGISLFLSLYSDPMIFVIFLLIPLFFPRLLSNIFHGEISPVSNEETAKTETGKNLWAYFLGRIKQTDFKNSILPTFVSVAGAYISLAIAYYSYKKWIEHIIKASLPSDVKPTIHATFPWVVLMALAFYFFIFFLCGFIKRYSIADLISFIKRYVVVGSNRYFLLLVYTIVGAGYSLSVFWLIPKLSNWAGYYYKFLQASETFGGGVPIYAWFVSAKYYMAVIANMYWLIIGGIGVRDYLPLYIDGPSLIINYHSITIFLLANISIIGLGLLIYRVSSKNKQVLVTLIAVYITTAWITLIQSQQGFYLPYANYFYGSEFSIVFAIFVGVVLASFAGHKKIYAVIMIAIIAASFLTYNSVKQINAGWKGGHYRGNDIDGFYKEYIRYWKDVKNRKIDFDINICSNISKELHYSARHRDAFITYGIVQEGIAFNKDNMKAISFAAFCGDNHLITSNGLFGYKPSNLEKILLTQEQLKTSSSNETRHQAIDENPETYWHLKLPKEEKVDAYIELDMGAKRKVLVLRILPRRGSIDQLWDGDNAVWEGSDGGIWNAITRLNVDRAKLKNDEWIGFVLPQDEGRIYRYYRLRIRYGSFLSLAEIELYHR